MIVICMWLKDTIPSNIYLLWQCFNTKIEQGVSWEENTSTFTSIVRARNMHGKALIESKLIRNLFFALVKTFWIFLTRQELKQTTTTTPTTLLLLCLKHGQTSAPRCLAQATATAATTTPAQQSNHIAACLLNAVCGYFISVEFFVNKILMKVAAWFCQLSQNTKNGTNLNYFRRKLQIK